MEATVKWFNNEKGYGFIEYKNGQDIFVHYSSLLQDGFKTLAEGDVVEFCLIKTPKGYQAKYVILKTKQKANRIVTRENIELVAAIATIISSVLNFIGDKDNKNEIQININCQNCEIQIVEQIDNQIENDLYDNNIVK